jgi:hypothetical protein
MAKVVGEWNSSRVRMLGHGMVIWWTRVSGWGISDSIDQCWVCPNGTGIFIPL